MTVRRMVWLGLGLVMAAGSTFIPMGPGSLAAQNSQLRCGALARSPVDVSYLLDAPADKHGFVQVKDGHLATGDGQRIRFWGVNITDWSKGSLQIPAKEDAEFIAGTLARFEVNSVRFQFLDLEETRGLITRQENNTEPSMQMLSTGKTTSSPSLKDEAFMLTSTYW